MNKHTINIEKNFSIVLKKLNLLRNKILIVLNQYNKVVGSITDGDVRRFFLKKKKKSIKNLMNPNPLIIYKNKPLIISNFKKKLFKYAPLVDRNKKFIKLINLKNFFDIDAVSVLIMAGGKGLRLRPLTKTIPKPLIQIKNITLLDRIIIKLLKEKFIDFNISVNYQKNKIISHIVNKFDKKISIKFIREKKFLGTAGSLNLLKTKKKIILIINADIYTNLNFKNIINHHLETNADITVGIKENNVSNPYGLIQLNKDKIISYEEKPIQKYLFNAGIYVINNRAIDLIPKNKKFDMSELITKALSRKKIVSPFYIYEEWKDIGNKETLINLEKKYNKYFK